MTNRITISPNKKLFPFVVLFLVGYTEIYFYYGESGYCQISKFLQGEEDA